MTYRFGMKGAPAVGGGLGGLPGRAALGSEATKPAPEQYFSQFVGLNYGASSGFIVKNGISWRGGLSALLSYGTAPATKAFIGVSPGATPGGSPVIPAQFSLDTTITRQIKNFGTHFSICSKKNGYTNIDVGLFSGEGIGQSMWTTFSQSNNEFVDVCICKKSRTVYALNENKVYAYDLDTGAFLWGRQHSFQCHYIAVSREGRLYALNMRNIYEISPADGSILAGGSLWLLGSRIEGVEAGPHGLVVFSYLTTSPFTRSVCVISYDFVWYRQEGLFSNYFVEVPFGGFALGDTGVFSVLSGNSGNGWIQSYLIKVTDAGVFSVGYGEASAACVSLGVDEKKNVAEFSAYGSYWKVRADGLTPTNPSAKYFGGNLSLLVALTETAMTPSGPSAGTNVTGVSALAIGGSGMPSQPITL